MFGVLLANVWMDAEDCFPVHDIYYLVLCNFAIYVVCCRQLVMAVSMTACDLCSMYKPWDLQVQLVHVIMEEFWIQVYFIRMKHKCQFVVLAKEKWNIGKEASFRGSFLKTGPVSPPPPPVSLN